MKDPAYGADAIERVDRAPRIDRAPHVERVDHPFAAEVAALGAPAAWRFSFDLRASPDALWPVLVDTTRLNRALGLAPMEFVEAGGVARGASSTAGFPYTWTEPPWAWVSGRYVTCYRVFDAGIATHVAIRYDVEPRPGGGSRVRASFDWYPRAATLRPLFWPIGVAVRRRYERTLQQLDAEIAEGVPRGATLARGGPALGRAGRDRIRQAGRDLEGAGVPGEIAARILGHVERGDDLDLRRIRARALARRWRMDERALLIACFHATQSGILELRWDVLCPHCRGVKQAVGSLGEIPARASCASCAAEFGTDAENAIEVTFRVHPSIRVVRDTGYCLSETSAKAHVHVQQPLGPGERRVVETALAPGSYRVRHVGEEGSRRLEVHAGPPGAEVSIRRGESAPIDAAAAPTLILDNPGEARTILVVEDPRSADDAVLPADLFGLQEFRDLFATEHLAPDVQLAVGEQTILFTDVVGSTAFYEHRGDARAFAAIRRHFIAAFGAVGRHRGVVVKTIGDAVMAAFVDPLDALRAAHDLARRAHGAGEDALYLRISLNRGTCIAVNLNSGIDYFGRTVNTAAKLQACISSGQIAFPASLSEEPGVRAFLEAEGAHLEEIDFVLPAPGATIPVLRWDTALAATGAPASRAPRSEGFY